MFFNNYVEEKEEEQQEETVEEEKKVDMPRRQHDVSIMITNTDDPVKPRKSSAVSVDYSGYFWKPNIVKSDNSLRNLASLGYIQLGSRLHGTF